MGNISKDGKNTMQPSKGDTSVSIPVTFDNKTSYNSRQEGRWGWTFLLLGVWLLSVIFVITLSDTSFQFFYPFISFFVLSYIFRFLIMSENYYKKKRRIMIENDYVFDHDVFWNVYDISDRAPYIMYLGSGVKCIAVAFDKDVIVGKGYNANYEHHEAIKEALRQVAKRGVDIMHIDYMDTVGKDDRLQGLFRIADNAENPDIQTVLTRIYDHIDYKMNKAYASYDVYCFYSTKNDNIFWDDVRVLTAYFLKANYLKPRVLSKDDISELVPTLFNLQEFSITQANDAIFRGKDNGKNRIKLIWRDRGYGDLEVVNLTPEEEELMAKTKKSEKKVKRKRGKLRESLSGSRNKDTKDEEINLFE